MNATKKNILRLAVAALPVLLQGCGTLAAPQMLALSVASTVAGGYANGGLMAGSTVGVIRNAAFGDGDGTEPQLIVPVAKTAVAANDAAAPTTVAVTTAAVARESTMPKFANAVAANDSTTPTTVAVATVAVARDSTMPKFANGLERACYFPNASGRGLPCT
jgi:hypothetical protein